MARKIDSRLKISLTLAARTPLHVGGMGASVDTDLALAINGAGDYYVPGTSLAGALRGWLLTRALDDQSAKEKIEALWGWQEKSAGHASFVLIEDARISPPPGKQIVFTEIRDGVGIDRVTGAAANQIKFDRAILPRGTQLSFEMLVELAADQDNPKNPRKKIDKSEERNIARFLTQRVLTALQAGQIRFGAAKSRGLGRVTVLKKEICEQQLRNKAGLLATLRGQGATPQAAIGEPVTLQKAPRLEIDISWKPCGPLMVKAEHEGFAVDMLPLVSSRDVMTGALSFVLPGSSIKGALRSQAERIIRTLWKLNAEKIVEHKRDFINQIETKRKGEETSLIGWLFGIAGKPDQADDELTRLPGVSALTIDDCYADNVSFNEQQWSAVEQAKDERDEKGEMELHKCLKVANLEKAQQAFHVAIDRWLGGAADSALYSVLEPHGVTWEHLNLALDLARLPDEAMKQRAVMLLLLTLRDFAAGRIPLGFGTNRGMGAVEVTDVKFTTHECEALSWLAGYQNISGGAGKLSVPDALREKLNTAWTAWLSPAKGGDAK